MAQTNKSYEDGQYLDQNLHILAQTYGSGFAVNKSLDIDSDSASDSDGDGEDSGDDSGDDSGEEVT